MSESQLRTLPGTIEVVLRYPYIFQEQDGQTVKDEFGRNKLQEFVYSFPRLRAKDAEIDEAEAALGNGRRLTPADKLSRLALDIRGWEGFGLEPRSQNESDADYTRRVRTFFSDSDRMDFAEDALTGRINAVYPAQTFRGPSHSGVEVNLSGAKD